MKTSELTGAALDWAVCEAESLNAFGFEVRGGELWTLCSDREYWKSDFSSNWAQGGPIIERERIAVEFGLTSHLTGRKVARFRRLVWSANKYGTGYDEEGFTPLIAAMRCYVASKLGDEVEIPEGLK